MPIELIDFWDESTTFERDDYHNRYSNDTNYQ